MALRSVLHLAAAAARVGVTEGSHTLWLRACCLAERVATALDEGFFGPPGAGSTAEPARRRRGDPGLTALAEWFDVVLGPKTAFADSAGNGGGDGGGGGSEERDGNDGGGSRGAAAAGAPGPPPPPLAAHGAAVVSRQTLELACLALCDCVAQQSEPHLQILCQAMRARKALHKVRFAPPLPHVYPSPKSLRE